MGLRCFLFSSDEAIAGTIRLVLADLGVEGEACSEAVTAAERIAHQSFQIVIIDWDKQPEAGVLLNTARQRKAAERPITLAIVSDDVSVPKALQAGANSILRKPLVVAQAKDTLTTARDLLRARRDPAPSPASSAQPDPASLASIRAGMEQGKEKTLRAGEFLQSAPATPGGSFVTESDVPSSLEPSVPEQIDPLKDLEPVAASVVEKKPEAPQPPAAGETRGLEWYLKARGVNRQTSQSQAPPAPRSDKPELLSYDQTPSSSASSEAATAPVSARNSSSTSDQKKEAELFAYIDGVGGEPEARRRPRFRLGKGAIGTALVLASIAIVAAPQAPWHAKLRTFWSKGQHAAHAWLNPQPVTPAQAPTAHEDFARAGDEYKLPAAESIPDATTDPSQIQVVPVIDPTAKKQNNDGANATQPSPAADGASTVPANPPQATQVPIDQPPQTNPGNTQPLAAPSQNVPSVVTVSAPAGNTPIRSEAPEPVPITAVPAPAAPKITAPRPASTAGNIPSSLKSQLAPATPDPVGNKLPDGSLPSIEPVVVPEAAERSLLIDQSALPYPANARGQQGTVVLQVLIGRDGAVQDAKFLQGSLAFARVAIDGVRQWKFKPYILNGHPVSVQTILTMSFKPTS